MFTLDKKIPCLLRLTWSNPTTNSSTYTNAEVGSGTVREGDQLVALTHPSRNYSWIAVEVRMILVGWWWRIEGIDSRCDSHWNCHDDVREWLQEIVRRQGLCKDCAVFALNNCTQIAPIQMLMIVFYSPKHPYISPNKHLAKFTRFERSRYNKAP